jgi:hypothetical protein
VTTKEQLHRLVDTLADDQVERALLLLESITVSTGMAAKRRRPASLAIGESGRALCVDEKSEIQALDRTAPVLPMQPRLAERRTARLRPPRHHDPIRGAGRRYRKGHRRMPPWHRHRHRYRHRHQEFLRFLKQVARAYPMGAALVMDYYAAHKRIEVRDWLVANPACKSTSPRSPGRR